MRKALTLENALSMRDRASNIETVSPYLFPSWGIHRARYKGVDAFNLQIGGTDPGYAGSGVEMKEGHFLSDVENSRHMPVVVIGEDLGKAWFQNTSGLGKWIDIDGHGFEVIGVMNRPTQSMPGQED